MEALHILFAPVPVVLLCYSSEVGVTFTAARRQPHPSRGLGTLGCPRTCLECESHSLLGIAGGTWNKVAGGGSAAKRIRAGEGMDTECASARELTRERLL
jgi:hypothetical protein